MAVDLATRPTQRADAFEEAWSDMVMCWWSDGVWPGQLNRGEVYADGTFLGVKVRSLKCNIQGFHGQKETESQVPLAPADPTNARVDRIVARLDRTKPATIKLDTVTGTPGSSSPNPLVRNSTTYDFPLGRVPVPAGATSIPASAVIDDRDYAAPRVQSQVGEVTQYLGTVAPEGKLLMAGQTVNRVDFPALAKMLGITTDTFVVPDMRGRHAVGAASTSSPGAIGGQDEMALTSSHNGPHVHGITDPGHRHPIAGDGGFRILVTASSVFRIQAGGNVGQEVSFTNMDIVGTGISIQSSGSGTPFSLHTPYRGMNYIVKAH